MRINRDSLDTLMHWLTIIIIALVILGGISVLYVNSIKEVFKWR